MNFYTIETLNVLGAVLRDFIRGRVTLFEYTSCLPLRFHRKNVCLFFKEIKSLGRT